MTCWLIRITPRTWILLWWTRWGFQRVFFPMLFPYCQITYLETMLACSGSFKRDCDYDTQSILSDHTQSILSDLRNYVTANSCSTPGYAAYFAVDPSLDSSFWTAGLQQACVPPYCQSGVRNSVTPEQFWNCAESTELDLVGPTTNKNSRYSESVVLTSFFTVQLLLSMQTLPCLLLSHNPQSQRHLQSRPLSTETTNCVGLWGACTDAPCCSNSASTCVYSNQSYSQCLPSKNLPPNVASPTSQPMPDPKPAPVATPTSEPVPDPTSAPVPVFAPSPFVEVEQGCCTHNWSQCTDISWCGSTIAKRVSRAPTTCVLGLKMGFHSTCIPRCGENVTARH